MLAPDGRVIMITGANRGIGLATATALSRLGYRLSLGVRNPPDLDPAAFTGDTIIHEWDATKPATSQRWAEATLAHYQRIDGAVLNAGVVMPVDLNSDSETDLDTMLEVNFKGPLRLTRAILPALKNSGHGRIITIASLSGKRLMSESNFGYSASKFAVTTLNHAIRQHGWDSGVRATAICPGLVDTDMVANIATPAGEFKIPPDAIAATVAYALSLPNAAAVAEVLVNSRLEPMF